MIQRLKHGVTVLALYAMALHVLLAALAPISAGAGAAIDPFSVICHSVAPDDTAPRHPALTPGQACEHCNLCSAASPPPAPDVALAIKFTPTIARHIVVAAELPPRTNTTADPKLARAPPPFA
jgi:hypothetical protein